MLAFHENRHDVRIERHKTSVDVAARVEEFDPDAIECPFIHYGGSLRLRRYPHGWQYCEKDDESNTWPQLITSKTTE